MLKIFALLVASLLVINPAFAKTKRSASAKHEFQREHPCPATEQPRGKCPGYIIDHITPLCAGGADAPTNMQWQTLADSKAKDVEELRYCRALKSGAQNR